MTSKPDAVLRQIEVLPNKEHSQTFIRFYNWLIDEEDSKPSNGIAYMKTLRMFSIYINDTKLEEVKKEDVIDFLNTKKKPIDIDPDKKWVRTWNDYFNRLTGFYRWLHNYGKIEERESWITPEPFSIIKRKKDKRISSYSANDVWTQDEILLVVKYIQNPRDKFILTGSWDMVARNHEMTKIRIRDIVLKEKYAEISTAPDTKTGVRTNPIIIGFPYLRDLLNVHPFSTDPNAFLLLSKTSLNPLTPDSIWRIFDRLKKRITKMLTDDQIHGEDRGKLQKLLSKKWNPYLVGRHSSITEKSDDFSDFQLKQYAGWTVNSNRPKTYVHRKGKAIIRPLLEKHGIVEVAQPKEIRKICSKCGYINTVESTICKQCSFVLNVRAWEQTKIEEEQKNKDIHTKLDLVMRENQSIKEQLEKSKTKNTLYESDLINVHNLNEKLKKIEEIEDPQERERKRFEVILSHYGEKIEF